MRKGDIFPISPTEDYALRYRMERRLARFTGEVRPPRSGEWFLSGAIVEAYYAPNDLTSSYPIAEIVTDRRTR